MKILNLLLAVLFLFLNGCLLERRITKEIAIQKAENFITEQGYTEKLISLDSTKTRIDINEVGLTREETAKWRSKSINSKAVYATKYGLGWLVAFTSNNTDLTSYQDSSWIPTRAVIVSRNGERIHIEHQSYMVDKSKIMKR